MGSVDQADHAALDEVAEIDGIGHRSSHAPRKRLHEGNTGFDSLPLGFTHLGSLHRWLRRRGERLRHRRVVGEALGNGGTNGVLKCVIGRHPCGHLQKCLQFHAEAGPCNCTQQWEGPFELGQYRQFIDDLTGRGDVQLTQGLAKRQGGGSGPLG